MPGTPERFLDIRRLAEVAAENERKRPPLPGVLQRTEFIGSPRCTAETVVVDGVSVRIFKSHDYGSSLATPPVGLTPEERERLVSEGSSDTAERLLALDRRDAGTY